MMGLAPVQADTGAARRVHTERPFDDGTCPSIPSDFTERDSGIARAGTGDEFPGEPARARFPGQRCGDCDEVRVRFLWEYSRDRTPSLAVQQGPRIMKHVHFGRIRRKTNRFSA